MLIYLRALSGLNAALSLCRKAIIESKGGWKRGGLYPQETCLKTSPLVPKLLLKSAPALRGAFSSHHVRQSI